MSTPNYFRLLTRSWRLVFLVTFMGALLALAFSFAQPLRYSSTERVLITQSNIGGMDPYTAIKSTERIAQNLSEIIYTSSFFNSVMSKAQIDPSYFPADEISKRKKWRDTVETSIVPGTGVVSIIAYHPNVGQATEIAVRVAEELVAVTPNYFGTAVRVQIIDDPLPSRFFAKPDVVRNALIGALVGFLLASAWVLGRVKNPV